MSLAGSTLLRTPGALVLAAAAGDAAAWGELVDRHSGLLWSITRSFRLSPSDATDAMQTAWLRLTEHVDRLEDPERVTAWLATTTRRECLRLIALRRRLVLAGDETHLLETGRGEVPSPSDRLVAQEEAVVVRAALAQLPERWQRLMELLMQDPPPAYEEISRRLSMPIGSIGPTRGRCLQRLRAIVACSVSR